MCNKNTYISEAEAKSDASQMCSSQKQSKHFDGKKKLTPYHCHDCGQWHLTSSPPNKQRNFKRWKKRAK